MSKEPRCHVCAVSKCSALFRSLLFDRNNVQFVYENCICSCTVYPCCCKGFKYMFFSLFLVPLLLHLCVPPRELHCRKHFYLDLEKELRPGWRMCSPAVGRRHARIRDQTACLLSSELLCVDSFIFSLLPHPLLLSHPPTPVSLPPCANTAPFFLLHPVYSPPLSNSLPLPPLLSR